MWKIILLAAACLIVGFIVGGFAFMAYYMPPCTKMMFLFQEREVVKFSEAALDAYYNEPNEISLWAWNYYIKAIDEIVREREPLGIKANSFIFIFDQEIVFAHARLGILYRKIGDLEKSKYHFDKAMSLLEPAGMVFIKTQEDLEELIFKFDRFKQRTGKSTSG